MWVGIYQIIAGVIIIPVETIFGGRRPEASPFVKVHISALVLYKISFLLFTSLYHFFL